MTASERRRILLPLCILAAVLLLLPVLVLSGMTRAAKVEIGTEVLTREATAVATDLASELARAAVAGVPLDRIPGVDGYLDQLLRQYSSIRFLALLAPDGRIIDVSGANPEQMELLRKLPKRRPSDTIASDSNEPLSVTIRKGRNPVMRIDIATPAGWASLVYGSGPAHRPPVLSPEARMLARMLAIMFLLGLPILYDTVHRSLFRPMRQLHREFAEAAEGRIRFIPAGLGRGGVKTIVRLWNNEVLGLQERHSQFADYAREAVGAADDPAVAGEIERLVRTDSGEAELAPATDPGPPGFGSELRVPALLLCFIAVTAFGNWPGAASDIAAAGAVACGLAAGWLLARRHVAAARASLFAGCLAFAAVMLVSATAPYLLPEDAELGPLWVIPNALLLGLLVGAALCRPAGAGPDTAAPGSPPGRREPALLILHLLAGLLAALIWNHGGLSATDDTLEVWIAALFLPVIAALLRGRP